MAKKEDEDRTERDEASAGDGGDAAEEGAPDSAGEAPTAAERAAPARPRRRRAAASPDADAASASEATDTKEAAFRTQQVTLSEERNARRALGVGGVLSALGLALVGTGPSDAGTPICIAGLLILIYGIHTFGRLGPEPAK